MKVKYLMAHAEKFQSLADAAMSRVTGVPPHNRGALSADTLRGMGYKNARYIAGGLKAYRTLP